MVPQPGTLLGQYEILSLCGVGGMGEVYRARDRTLGREVAIKLLPERFSLDRERLARFEREARLLDSLNHANIATLHGFEEEEGRRFLAMELVLGETLAERLDRGKLTWQECLPIFIAMADGLECAHEAGVVHRDLKPSNVKVTPLGVVKILDFGLAKTLAEDVAPPPGSELPTRDFASTGTGIVLGTTPYLSPEQTRGAAVDRRSDIWAFGCMLFEALSGKRAFSRGTVSETIAAILEREPDWDALPRKIPSRLQALLGRCFQKDPRVRLRDIGDARLELEACRSEEAPAFDAARTRSGTRWLVALPWVLASAFAIGAAVLWNGTRSPTSEQSSAARFEVGIPAGEVFGLGNWANANVALSRDGRTLAYVVMREGVTRLQVRSLGEVEPKTLLDTEGAYDPFFSPDGEWLGYFARSAMWKIPLRGGPPVTICAVPPVSRGATWVEDGTIIFAPAFNGGLSRVSSSGGVPSELTTLDRTRGEIAHLWPHALGGGQGVLFTMWTGGSFDTAKIGALSLSTGKIRTVVEAGSHPQYSGSGQLLFLRLGALLAQPFDVEALVVHGDPVTVVDRVMASAQTGAGEYAVSHSGTLAYVAADPSPGHSLLWVDRDGRTEPVAPANMRRDFVEVRLSPDGKQIAVGILNDIWRYELDRGSFHRLTFTGINQCPVWSPDGSEIVFSHAGPEEPRLFRVGVDGTGLSELIPEALRVQVPFSWSPDGTVLAYAETHAAAVMKGSDDWDILMLTAGKEPIPFVRQDFDQGQPMFSPDGTLVAFASNESGVPQVFVRPYPGGSSKWLVSPERGEMPMWSHDGKEIFYRDGDKVFAVSIETEPALVLAHPRVLFEGSYSSYSGVDGCSFYDVARDGRFLMIEKDPVEAARRSLQIVLNWPSTLDEKSR